MCQPPPTEIVCAGVDEVVCRLAVALLAQVGSAEAAFLLPKVMAAIAAVVRAVPSGATVLVQSQIYWGTTKWLREFCARRSVTLIEADLSDTVKAQSLCAHHQPDLVFIETPSNPWLRTTDISILAEATPSQGELLVLHATDVTTI